MPALRTTRSHVAAGMLLLLAACGESGDGGSSVVLVVVDTLRADHLGTYGYSRETTPELDRWAEGATVFDHAYAPSSWTLPSLGSLFTGRIPSRHAAGSQRHPDGSRDMTRLAREVPTLAERLRARGYTTAANANNPFLHPAFGLDRGFDEYDCLDFPARNESVRRADEIVDWALAWLERRPSGPFFLMLHVMDPHLDYDPPPPFAGRFVAGVASQRFELPVRDVRAIRKEAANLPAEDRAFVVAAYDEEVAFVDRELGRLFEGIAAAGILDQALVIFTADHGEELFDHDGFEHGHSMHRELLQVPLVVRGPGIVPRRIVAPVSLVDVVPTVLDAVGAPPEPHADGVSLWPALMGGEAPSGRALVAEDTLYAKQQRALIRWPHKVIVNVATGRARLFDLEADPGETENLARQDPAELQRLEVELEALLARRLEREIVGSELDTETLERLRDLGYVDD